MSRRTVHSRLFWKLFLSYSGLVLIITALIAMIQMWGFEVQFARWIAELQAENAGSADLRSEMVSQWRQTQLYVSETLIGGIVVSLTVSYILARRMTRPLGQMLRVSQSMLEGQYNQRVLSLPADEMGQLGRTLNRLSTEITSKIETISTERAQLKTILANMIEGIICVDEFGTVQFCNQAAYQLFEVSKADVRGMNLRDVSGFSVLADLVGDARRKQEPVSNELRVQRSDSDKRSFLEVHASPFASDAASGVIVVVHDVTKMRRLEKMRRDFVANVSHEIKTPLTAIRGYVETLLSDGLDDSGLARRFLEKVDANAKRLNILVLDILSLARIEDGEERLVTMPLTWDGVVQQVIASYEDQCAEKRLRIDIHLKPGLLLMGERESMHQVLDNLVSNAIRYTPEGGSIVVAVDRQQDSIILSVRDTGIGIPKKYQTRIFERFYRVDKARSRELGGTGLGLSIVKHLVLSMNGRIDVESEVGQGSIFRVALRCVDPTKIQEIPNSSSVGVAATTEIQRPIGAVPMNSKATHAFS